MQDPVQFKRQIIEDSERSGIRKKLIADHEAGRNTEDTLEMGAALESLTNHKGWLYVEQFMLQRADPVRILMDDLGPEAKFVAKAYISLMQYVAQVIKARKEIIAREKQAAGDAA